MPHVAEFAASLVYLRIKKGVPAEVTAAGLASFMAAYEAAAKNACDHPRVAWYVVAFLLGKVHSSLKNPDGKGRDTALPALSIVAEWLAIASGVRSDWGPEAFDGRNTAP